MLAVLMMTAALSVAPQTPPDPTGVVRLEDVVVDARRLEDAAEEFVDQVADPVGRRGMARWHEGVCVGVANLRPEIARYIADRVSDVARELGLRAHEPPCHPSILIVAAAGGAALTEQFVAMRPVLFDPGISDSAQGSAALEQFVASDDPVRWWTVSLKVDGDTGVPAARLPGQMTGTGTDSGFGTVWDYAPINEIRSVSRLSSQYRDDMKRAFVIVDVERIGDVSLGQLADYIAMVSLAQINPDADTSRFETILNLFDGSDQPAGLSEWDRAYLHGLYEADWYRISQNSQVHAISNNIAREYRDARDAEPVDGAE